MMRWSRCVVAACLALSACGFETADGTVENANEALAAGKVDEAVSGYAEAATRIPESPPLNFDRGIAASLAGDHEGAASFLLQALATKDKVLEQKVKAAIGTAYAREALVLERTPQPAAAPGPDGAPPPAETGAPKIPEPAMAKWKLAVEFLEDALTLDPKDLEARRSLEVALLRVDPPCATRDDKFEDNDNAGSAKPLEVKAEAPNQSQAPSPEGAPSEAAKDKLQAREQLFSCPDDDDWYALELAAGDRVELAPTVPKDAGRLRFELLRPDGQSAWKWTSQAVGATGTTAQAAGDGDAAPRHRFVVGPDEAGRWLVHQTNVDVDEVSYGLEVVVRPACDKVEDRYEDNDVITAAKQLTPGPVPDLKRCPADEDWYSVTLAEGESLFLYAQPTDAPDEDAPKPPEGAPPPPPPFMLEVLDQAGTVRSRGAPIDKSQVSTLLMPGAGRYYVRVFDRPLGLGAPAATEPYEGRYSLQVEIVPPCPEGDDRFEDNDDAPSATDLVEASQPPAAEGQPPQPPQGPPVVFARVCPGDVDWWKVASDGTKPQIVSLVFDHGQGDLQLELLDESGMTSIATSDTSSPEQNGEAVPLPMAEKPDPKATATPAPAVDPTKPEPPPPPKTYTLRIAAKGDAQNFYLLRLDQPSGGGGGDDGDSKDDSKDQQDPQDKGDKAPKDPSDSKDSKDNADDKKDDDKDGDKKDKANPLQDALDNLDRNPENLPARDAARKSPLANQKPLKDW